MTARLVAPEQGNAERNEGAFKGIKDGLLSRSNFKLVDAYPLLRRHMLARKIIDRTDTIASAGNGRLDTQLEDLRVASSLELGIGPAAIAGGDGESRRFEAVEVRTVFFVTMWLKWLPDYIIGHASSSGRVWWRDDDLPFSNSPMPRVRSTTVPCDFASTSGAELYDAKWMTERDMEGALILHTREIVANPSSFSIPGWESVESALEFLKSEAVGITKTHCACAEVHLAFLSDARAS